MSPPVEQVEIVVVLKRGRIKYLDGNLADFSAFGAFLLNVVSPLQSPFGRELRFLAVFGRLLAELEDIVVLKGLDRVGPALAGRISHDDLEVKITDSDSFLLLRVALVLSIGITVALAHEGFPFDQFPPGNVPIAVRTFVARRRTLPQKVVRDDVEGVDHF